MNGSRVLLAASLLLAGCGDETTEIVPICDDIGWPLGVEPVTLPPVPEFTVECADGWGNAVETRPALDTVALPDSPWTSLPHPDGGWIQLILPEHQPGWLPWLETQGIEPSSLPEAPVMLWSRQDGSLGWVAPEFGIWWVDFVGDELWALAWHPDDIHGEWLAIFDSATGELLDAHPWDVGPRYNLLAAARDPASGAWITAIEDREADDLVDQSLYRATSIDTPQLVATRTTEEPGQRPTGGIIALPDGAVAWYTGGGFEVMELDGSVRWTHPDGGGGIASDADSMLIASSVPTGVGAGLALRLEKVALADGEILWTREHRRYVVTEPENCGPEDCGLIDRAYPMLRPDGGYLLLGRHAYPSSTCFGQPLIMAVSADGEAEWAHRVETCGLGFRAAFRDDSKLELIGITTRSDASASAGAWTRWFDL